MRRLARTLPIEEIRKRARDIAVGRTPDAMKETEAYFDCPMIWFCNAWYEGGGDVSPPRYIPFKGFDGLARRVHNETNVSIDPSVAPLRMSTQLLEWDAEWAARNRIDGGAQTAFLPGEKDTWASMCWTTQYWRNLWRRKVKSLARLRVNGLHIDELASGHSFESGCSGRRHGHLIGGGRTYYDDHRGLLNLIRETGRGIDPNLTMHSEAVCEVYIDLLDAFETDTTGEPDLIPMFEAVYHDYQFIAGRRVLKRRDRYKFHTGGDDGLDELVSAMGQFFAWGSHVGHVRFDIASFSPKGSIYLKQLVDARLAAKKFLVYGDMMRPPKPAAPMQTVTVHWESADSPDVTLDAIQRSAWKAADGTLGLVFVNISDTGQTFEYEFDLGECYPGTKRFALSQIWPRGGCTGELVQSPVLKRKEKLEEHGVLIIQLGSN